MSPQNQNFSNNWNQPSPFRPVQGQAGGGQPAPVMTFPSPQAPKPKNNDTLVVIAIIVLVLLIGGSVWAFLAYKQGSDLSHASSAKQDQDTAQSHEEQDEAASNESNTSLNLEAQRAAGFEAPADWTICGGSGAPGNLNLVYSVTTVTSCPFSNNVRDAFVEQYLQTGSLNATVVASSPVTSRSYTMQCRDDGSTVTCTGGDNAVVVIV